MTIEITDAMIYAFAGEPEITATDAHAIRTGLTAALALVAPKHCEGLDPGDWPEADCGNHTPHPAHDRTPAQFWCWTEGEPSTFRCRERGHDVRETSPGGLTARTVWADSQLAMLDHVEGQLSVAEKELAETRRERDNLRELWAALVAEVNRLGGDLASARRDLARVSDWHTLSTHDDERGTCGGCGGHWPCHTRQILDGYLNPAYMTARCGQLSTHAPHISETGPDRPRNCPGVPVPSDGHTAGCVAGRECGPYCDSHPTRIARKNFRVVP